MIQSVEIVQRVQFYKGKKLRINGGGKMGQDRTGSEGGVIVLSLTYVKLKLGRFRCKR